MMFPFRKSVTSDKVIKKVDSLISEGEENFLLILSQSDNYGQNMVEIIADCSDCKIFLNPGSSYRTLKILCDKGMIKKKIYPTQVKDKRNSHKRGYYQITDKGRKELHKKREFREKLVENGKQITDDLSTSEGC